MKKFMFLAAAFLMWTTACRKDSIIIDTDIVYPGGAVWVKSSIGGVVTNENGQPVVGAKVRLSEKTEITDLNGVFFFKDLTVNALGAYVQVFHPNYFHGSRTVMVSAGTRNTVEIQLMSNRPTRFINADTGGEAVFDDDHSVTLPAGGIVTQGGQPYSGQVGVAAKWLNPVAENFRLRMPGRLEGVTANGELSGMVSLGMLAVELKDAAGNKLQIKDGHKAEIKVKVPQELLPTAPQTIPLWYFDEDKGWWTEEGQASRQGSFYVGKVSHFTYWNYDYYAPSVEVKFLLNRADGTPVEGGRIHILLANGNLVAHGSTDENGCVTGLVPKDETLTVRVYMANFSDCLDNAPLVSQQIGPFDQNGSVQLTLPAAASANIYHIAGKLTDCNDQPVTFGYVYHHQTGTVGWVDSDGNFSFDVVTCQPLLNVKLSGVDLNTLKGSGPLTFITEFGNSIFHVEGLSVCIDLQQYFTVEFDGKNYTYTYELAVVTFTDGGVWRQIARRHPAFEGYLMNLTVVDVTGPGTYLSPQFLLEGIEDGQPMAHSSYNEVTVNITEFSGPTGIIAGTYSGTAYLFNPDTIPMPPVIAVSGAFRVQQ